MKTWRDSKPIGKRDNDSLMKVSLRFLRFYLSGNVQGVFPRCSRFNHACPPFRNCTYAYNKEKNKLEVVALTRIEKGDELTISYGPDPTKLYEYYGFRCDCPSCCATEKTGDFVKTG